MTNDELMKVLKYIARKKAVTRREINRHINPKGDITNNQIFNANTDIVSDREYVKGCFVSNPEDMFELSIEGHNLLADHIKETKAIRRANLSLLISFAAALIAAAALTHSIFSP